MLLEEQTQSCPIGKITFNEYPYCFTNHIRLIHEQLCCDSCGECFITISEKKYHKKTCFKCGNCNECFTTISEKNDHKKTCFKCDNCNQYLITQVQLRKNCKKCISTEEEFTDESERSN